MPLYTAITQEGIVSVETKAKIAEEITRIHTSVVKVPKNFVRVVFLSYPKGVWVYRWRGSSYHRAQLCSAKRAYVGREDSHATAALDDVSGPDRDCYRSACPLASGNSIEQCHGDGPDHASGGTRIEVAQTDSGKIQRRKFV
jgi:phenylpyruvate tautomerase PptA (4-oxalocrotonate tautomerase family)